MAVVATERPWPGLVAAFGLAALTMPSTAYADGTVTVRNAYYKESATRVVQPMLDADLEVGERGQLLAHTLVDAITSASAASGAVGEPFTETRMELGTQYLHQLERVQFGGGFRYSTEPDYQSMFVTALAQVDFAQRNTTLGLTFGRGHDSLSNQGSQGALSSPLTGTLDTTMAGLSLRQLLSPVSVLSVSYDFTYLDGFQQNVYRTVVAGGIVQSERVPDTRRRHAVATGVRYFSHLTNTVLIGEYRLYWDDWGVVSHTPQLRAVQELLDEQMEVHMSYRYYRQRGASFYRDIYNESDMTVAPYVSDDDKLGRVRTHSMGLKLAVLGDLLGLSEDWKELRVETLVQYLKQDTHYGNAIVAEFAVTIPIEY